MSSLNFIGNARVCVRRPVVVLRQNVAVADEVVVTPQCESYGATGMSRSAGTEYSDIQATAAITWA
jgi:hypothetical protein